MRWPPWASDSQGSTNSSSTNPTTLKNDDTKDSNDNDTDTANTLPKSIITDLGTSFTELRTLIPTLILTSAIIFALRVRRRFLLRFPDAISIAPSYLRQRSIFGQVTSVGDGDNFRIYHTPGGRLVGWGWLPWRKVPVERKELKDNTIHIRLAGIDAPELAHFGRPAQPFAREAHIWLTNYLLHRRVRAYVHRHDQYQRVVASVYVRRGLDFPIPFRRRDVSYEMLKRGLATVYEAKSGAEFGGQKMERKYRRAERWAKMLRRGLWVDFGGRNRNKKNQGEWESPREYKTRMGMEDLGKNGGGVGHEDKK